jgi:hypothetical protein
MQRLFSNGPNKDFIRAAFERLAGKSQRLYLAAPYCDYTEPALQAASLSDIIACAGRSVQIRMGSRYR